jgi:hypothetical protein
LKTGEGMQQSPHWGVRPSPLEPPMIDSNYLTPLLTVPLQAITKVGSTWQVNYPLIWGNQVYRIEDPQTFTAPAHRQLMSAHVGYTYGQSFPVNWNCKGQSAFINVSDVSLFFPGLAIVVTTDTTRTYIVTSVYSTFVNDPPDGFICVCRAGEGPGQGAPITGTKTTVYSGATMASETMAFKFFDDNDYFPAAVTVANLPAASASNKGARRFVSDATVTTFWSVVAGSGGNTVPVTSDGTNWRIG